MKLEALDMNLLLVLHHVLDQGTVAGAAQRLGLSPPAVSNALGRLRTQLGDRLLVRSGRRLVPTPRARALAPELVRALDGLRAALSAVFDPRGCTRRFTLASADNIGVELLPRIVGAFARRLPRAGLRVVTLDHAIATNGLASGEVDALLGLPPPDPELVQEGAYSERLVCARWAPGARARRAKAARPVTLREFLGARHVQVAMQGRVPVDGIDEVLALRGQRRDIVLSVPQFSLAAMCLPGTDYVATLPAGVATHFRAALELELFAPPLRLAPVTVRQAWHRRTDEDPACRFFRELVHEAGAWMAARLARSALTRG